MLVGGANITGNLIHRLHEKNPDEMLSRQVIIAKVKEAVKEAKKIHGLMSVTVKEGVLQKVDGRKFSFPLGCTEDNFNQWLLKQLFNWDKYYGSSGSEQKPSNTTNDEHDGD